MEAAIIKYGKRTITRSQRVVKAKSTQARPLARATDNSSKFDYLVWSVAAVVIFAATSYWGNLTA